MTKAVAVSDTIQVYDLNGTLRCSSPSPNVQVMCGISLKLFMSTTHPEPATCALP